MKYVWRSIWVLIAAFPVLGAFQLFSKGEITPYDDYVGLLKPVYEFMSGNFSWLLIAFLSYTVVIAKLRAKFIFQEKIRKRQYWFEYERWRDTPFIPPLLLYYMMSPPTAYSPELKEQAHNDFYPLLVRDFQDRVTINASFNSFEPKRRPSAFTVVGTKIMGIIAIHVLALAAILYFTIPASESVIEVYTQTSAKFLIPVILHIVGYLTMIGLAIAQTAPWRFIDNRMLLYFKEDYLHSEPRIAWVDVLPDTDRGYGIEKMWEHDCFRRIRLTYEMKGSIFPHNHEEIEWDNPSIPGNPFPDNLDMDWVPRAREYVRVVHQKWLDNHEEEAVKLIEETKGQEVGEVVAFYKKGKV